MHYVQRAFLTLALALATSAQGAATWYGATVEFSDGRTVIGEITVPGGKIIIHNEAQKKRYNVRLAEIKRIDTVLERESMEKKWIFKEDGRDEKVYLDKTYPVRQFITRVTFLDDKALTGHTMGKTLYVRSDGQRSRHILRAKMEGKVGQTPADLVYVKTITMLGQEGSVLGSVSGQVELPAGERLLKMLAINRRGEFIIEGGVRHDGTFRFTHCTNGVYDLVVVTDKTIYLYFSREKDERCGRMAGAKLDEIKAWAASIRDFFHAQDPVYGGGNDKRAFVLVRKERYGGTSMARAKLIRRYGIWIMHKPYDQWQIIKRLYVSRELTEDKNDPRERIIVSPALGGHVVDAEHSRLNLTIELGPNTEPLVPETEPVEEQKDDD